MYKKILLTGSSGFVGTNVCKYFARLGYNVCGINGIDESKCNIITFKSDDYNLLIPGHTTELIDRVQPDCIIHLAARVGGIGANKDNPATFMLHNLTMGLNLIQSAFIYKVKKFINVSTICAYPKFTPVPFKEKDLWNGYPEETNAPYGIAKKTLVELLIAFNKQYNFNSINLFPTNMYGPHDNFDEQTSHVIPAIILKVYKAMAKGENKIYLWGTGKATRDFMYVGDFCSALNSSLLLNPGPQPINIGTNAEYSIKAVAEIICNLMNFQGTIIWDDSMPDGQPRRCVDTQLAQNLLNYNAQTQLISGLHHTIEWFVEERKKINI